MLNFIFGRAGSGKSKFLKDLICKKIQNGDKNIILIVPEQSSFANEKEIIDLLGNSDCNSVNVLSFSRLYDFTARKLNLPINNPMSDATQNILMSSAIENVKNHLEIYHPGSKTDIEKIMLQTIREFKFQKIEAENLKTNLNSVAQNGILKKKAGEIALILKEYNRLCADSFIDTADKINMAEQKMRKYNIFGDYTVIFDEFNSFTEQQLTVIELILRQAKDVYMAFCTDIEQNRRMFMPMNKIIKDIKKMAQRNNVQISQEVNLTAAPRFLNNEILTLEHNIFNTQKICLNAPPQNIHLYAASNIYEECENIAQNILKTVIEQKYRYSDIAILTRNIDCYQSILKNVFKKYKIPLFLDCPETILDKSLVNLVLSAMNCIISGFQTSDVIRYIKSGLFDCSLEEICRLENYALLWNIKSNGWYSTFTAHPRGFSENRNDDDIALLENINATKEKLITPLIKLKNVIGHKTSATDISRAIYEFLIEVGADINLKKLYTDLKSSGALQTAEKEAKTWDSVMSLLSLTSQIMGNKKISAKDYLRILISGLESIDCSSIPPTQDSVVAAGIPGARLSNPKIVFLIGVSDGEFPAPPKSSAVFTESETAQIESLGMKICENKDYIMLNEQFLAYTALCSASEKLYLSWSVMGSDTVKTPSEIIMEIKQVFPNIKVKTRNNYSTKDSIWCENSAFELYCTQKNKYSRISYTLGEYFEKSQTYSQKLHTLKNFSDTTNLYFKDKKIAQKLFGKNMKLSASQIDYYYKCPFGYLCKYGLKLKSAKPAKFSSAECGNLIHRMFETLFKKYPKNKILEISEETLKNDISEIIDGYAKLLLDNQFTQNPRIINIIENAKKLSILLVRRIISELKQSEFIISDCELEISPTGSVKPLKFTLDNHSTVEIDGKIDRIDTMKTDGHTYIRIVDYKTGKTDFDLTHILYGLSMQTLIYLYTLTKSNYRNYSGSLPAGALYFKASQPSVDSASYSSTSTQKDTLIQKLRLNGLFLDNQKILNAMDNSDNKDYIYLKKDKKNEATLEEFDDIFKYIEIIIKDMGSNLQNGIFEINPTKLSDASSTPCEFCEYIPICHHNKEKFQKIETQKRDNIFWEIKQKRSDFFSE